MNQSRIVFANACLVALTAADFETLAQLAETIWRAHYSRIISNAQIDYMLVERYTPQKLCLYLDADDRWLMLLRIDNRAVGYCSYALTDDLGEMKPGEMKLEQLYLLPELHCKWLGRLMLRHVEEQARVGGRNTLVLQVNKRNDIAIAFDRKAGFTVREEAVFDTGNGFMMDDYVMEKVL
jgi:diamine N-acetyltransferase